MSMPMHDFVFRGDEYIPLDVAEKRITAWRKKHPEDFEALDTMKKKAYPEGLPEVKNVRAEGGIVVDHMTGHIEEAAAVMARSLDETMLRRMVIRIRR
jgi:hypothetical protein